MPEIALLDIDDETQNEFYIHRYPEFLGCAVYGYLFEGLYLRDIESRYLHNDKLNGFFAKGVLNSMGIKTPRSELNRGIYKDCNVLEVASELLVSSNPQFNNIGRALCDFAKCRLEESRCSVPKIGLD